MGRHQEESHEERSSSMTFALRWKHEHIRMISLIALCTILSAGLFVFLMNGASGKTLTLVVDGQEKQVETKKLKVADILKEEAIVLGEHDKISTPLSAEVKDGDKIKIQHAIPYTVTVDGKTKTYYTTAKTVQEALDEISVTLDADDRITPAINAQLVKNTSIEVVRVTRFVAEAQEKVPFNTIQKKDAKLLKGKTQVVQPGQAGLIVRKIEKTYENGQLINKTLLQENVVKKSQDQIVAIGTKKPVTILSSSSPDIESVTKGEITFAYKQVLKNVTLTAYHAGASSTGKTKKSKGYGITYSGTRVTEGRTIAVDPKVIPIGWWVYIEGLGFRRAEDKGSAVKGKKIDVFFEDGDYAEKFGMKRGYTVYVIGPKKPQAN